MSKEMDSSPHGKDTDDLMGIREKYYILHTFPDADAICASWLGVRKLFPLLFPGEILTPYFSPFNQIDSDLFAQASAVFDIGNELDLPRLRFDHHQLENPRSICTTRLVWEYLTKGYGSYKVLCPDLMCLKPLIDLVEAGDVGADNDHSYATSKTVGLHALLQGFRMHSQEYLLKLSGSSILQDEKQLIFHLDYDTLHYGWGLLDTITYGLQQSETAAYLDDYVVFKSKDELLWGFEKSSYSVFTYSALKATFVKGAGLIVTGSVSHLPTSYALEIWVSQEIANLDLKKLVQALIDESMLQGNKDMYQELQLFYCEAKYAGRGSPKAPNSDPPSISVAELARAIDSLWQR